MKNHRTLKQQILIFNSGTPSPAGSRLSNDAHLPFFEVPSIIMLGQVRIDQKVQCELIIRCLLTLIQNIIIQISSYWFTLGQTRQACVHSWQLTSLYWAGLVYTIRFSGWSLIGACSHLFQNKIIIIPVCWVRLGRLESHVCNHGSSLILINWILIIQLHYVGLGQDSLEGKVCGH